MVKLGQWLVDHKVVTDYKYKLAFTFVKIVGLSDWAHCVFIITTQSQYYHSTSSEASEGWSFAPLDAELVVVPDEVFQPTLV